MVVSRDEALDLAKKGRLAALGDRDIESVFKIDLLNEIPEDEEISIYKNGDFWDLCAGPHVPRTGNCKAFKVMSVASAFYKGDADNPQLQRVYGTAFKNKTFLNAHLEQVEEAKQRDHRKIGKDLDLFHIDEAVGAGIDPLETQWRCWFARNCRTSLANISTARATAKFSLLTSESSISTGLRGHFPYYSRFAVPAADGARKQ